MKTAAFSMAICVTLTGKPQSPAQQAGAPAEQETSPQPGVPAEVDQALRSRITQFYGLLVQGKYRAADQFVAEDSKDPYFGMAKPHIKGFEISRIAYSDHFTKAEVTMICPADWYIRGQKLATKVPTHDLWKLENGDWFWYVAPEGETLHTPMGGTRKRDPASSDAEGDAVMAQLKDIKGTARVILSQVTLDRSTVVLKINRKDSAEVLVKNAMPGMVEIRVDAPKIPGFSVTAEKEKLGAGETGKILLRTAGAETKNVPADAKVSVLVQPLMKVLPVTVRFVVVPDSDAPARRPDTPASTDKPKSQKS